ncbi:MAG: hypothetical protein RMM53_05530, partial [Bacteroidia bacterium]|nr:hypothetical protein [Bacteroidia bacterium]
MKRARRNIVWLATATLSACAPEPALRSPRFWDFWADTTGVFRGLKPGDELAAARMREVGPPRYDD